MDVLVNIFVEFYAAFVDLSEVSVSSEASQNGSLCHSYVLALNTWTTEGVILPNYIPTLQVNPGGRNDIIKIYFCLGLDYTEILLYLDRFIS